MSNNDPDPSNNLLASNTESIEFHEIINTDETVANSTTPVVENTDLVHNDKPTSDSTLGDRKCVSRSLELTLLSQTTHKTTNDDQYFLDIDKVSVKLRLIEKLINSCKDLIKQSTSIDACIETFTKNFHHFSGALIQAGNDLKH
ncbi:unnamed protein product [Rotaria sp. Silwood2]|nr:unnamed protein product [Rotaria sp. Silwood2]CAF3061239.1 unnamed protein product [Rotaria sp. Silwood2]CAF3418459.1 unnamed protein product [Rotaria sp. Silwood2]CAF3532698.1 unnamed protein product [Rotaria sp. Silwood2]CAF4155644.1 unnamed protein product [Rotaria sp. Silwood2]